MSNNYSNSRNKPRPNSRGTKNRNSGVKYGSNPQGDVAISKSKNGVPSDDMKVLQSSSIKRVVSKDIDELPIKNKFETDAEIAHHTSSLSRMKHDEDIDLEPYFNNTDKLDEDSLEKEKDGQHWFPPDTMFEVNQKQFNVSSSYDDALSSYTIALDKSLPDYAERSARAEKLALEIEQSSHSRIAADLENDEGAIDDDDGDEERKHSAVVRPNQQSSAASRGKMQSNSRAEALRSALSEKQHPNSFNRHGGNHRSDYRKYHSERGSSYTEFKKSDDKARPIERSLSLKNQVDQNDFTLENTDKLTIVENQDNKTPDISSEVSTPLSKTNEDSGIPQSPELLEVKSEKNMDSQKKTSLNPDAPEFKPKASPTDNPTIAPTVPQHQVVSVPVSYAPHPVYQQQPFTYPASTYQTIRQPSGTVVATPIPNGSKIRNVPQAVNNQAQTASLPSPHQSKYALSRSGDVANAHQQLVGSNVVMVQNNPYQQYFIQPSACIQPKPTQPVQHQQSTAVTSSQSFQNHLVSSQPQNQPIQQQAVPQPQSHVSAQPAQPMMFFPSFNPNIYPQHAMPIIQPIPANQTQSVHHQTPNLIQVHGHAGVPPNSQSTHIIYQQQTAIPYCTNGASLTSHAMIPGTTVSSMPNPQNSQYYPVACQLTQNTYQMRPAPIVHQQQAHPMPNPNINFNHSQSAQSVSYMPRSHNQHPNS